MEKCSKKSKQLCLSLFKPSVMMLTTGFLCMASFQGLAAVEPSHNYGPNVESVMQNGKTVTVKVSDSMGELIGANVLVKGTTIGNVTDMNGNFKSKFFYSCTGNSSCDNVAASDINCDDGVNGALIDIDNFSL